MNKSLKKEEKDIRSKERWIFFKRWIRNPKQMGTIAPISPSLAQIASKFIKPGRVIELGAGTGRLTRMLCPILKNEKFAALELDKELCGFLKETLPLITKNPPYIIEGDARYIKTLLPESFEGKVDTIISVLPFMYMPKDIRDEIIDEALSCLSPNGVMIHVTYNPWSPIVHRTDIQQTRLKTCFHNIPPGYVWRFKAAIPASVRPSINSINAPPAVEI